MTIENPTVKDMELIALNLHREGENSRSEALYKFIAKYKANERKVTALETAGRELVAATNYDQERRRNIPSVIYKLIMRFAALLGETK